MKRETRNRWFYALSICAAAMPFAFALIRAVRTGYDVRYLGVALASLLGAAATVAIARTYATRPIAAVALAATVFVSATLLAVLAALLIGTRLGLGIVTVAAAFGFCFALGALLFLVARFRTV